MVPGCLTLETDTAPHRTVHGIVLERRSRILISRASLRRLLRVEMVQRMDRHDDLLISSCAGLCFYISSMSLSC